MATDYIKTWMYLGKHADIDPDESSLAAENSEIMVGLTFDQSNASLMDITLTNVDDDGSGDAPNEATHGYSAYRSDHDTAVTIHGQANDTITYDVGNGLETSAIDGLLIYTADILLGDGTTITANLSIAQMQDGSFWIRDGSDLSNLNIQSITFTSAGTTNFSRFTENSTDSFWTINNAQFVCFTYGTKIRTIDGDVPIQNLCVGDMVVTMDHGPQAIRWIGSAKRKAMGDLAPILIRKGVLGNTRDLMVSHQHRMLFSGWQAELYFGEYEVLAAAKFLINDHSIVRVEGGEVEYYHILFDTHEIIYAEDAPSESFHPGEQGWSALEQGTRDEILKLFPELASDNFSSYGSTARMCLKNYEARVLDY